MSINNPRLRRRDSFPSRKPTKKHPLGESRNRSSCGNFAPLTSSRTARGSAMLRIPRTTCDVINFLTRSTKNPPRLRGKSRNQSSCGNFAPTARSRTARRVAMLRIPRLWRRDRVPYKEHKKHPSDEGCFLWCSCGNSNPGPFD